MSELCLDCLNKIMGSNYPPRKFLISKELDLCEECGELKPVVIRIKWRYAIAELFRERMEDFKNSKQK